MNVVKMDVKELINKELENAKKWPMYSSPHEFYGVVKEEIEECNDEMIALRNNLESIWVSIKKNEYNNANATDVLHRRAIKLACEAIQVGAVALKMSECGREKENE